MVIDNLRIFSAYVDDDSEKILAPLEDGKVVCLKCGKQLSNVPSGKRHYLATHRANTPSVCEICKKVFKNKLTAESHMRRTHGISTAMMNNAISIPIENDSYSEHENI